MEPNYPEIVKLAGPDLIVVILTWGLFGVLSVQVYLYSQVFSNDRLIFKAMVYGVYLLETTQTFLLTGTAWTSLVKGFGHPDTLYKVGTTWVSVCLIGGATALVAQTFYAYRISIISQKWIIPSFIMLMSITSFIAAVVVSVMTKQAVFLNSDQMHTLRISTIVGIWAGISCTSDIVIAMLMCFYLRRRIRDGCFPKTEDLLRKVMRMTIETGTLTASVSIVTLAMYYAPGFGGFMYYGVPISVLAKLYSNTTLALLNSRIKLGIVAQSTTWQENELPSIPLSHPRRADGIEINFALPNNLENVSAIGLERGAIAVDEAKMIFSVPHNCEEIVRIHNTV